MASLGVLAVAALLPHGAAFAQSDGASLFSTEANDRATVLAGDDADRDASPRRHRIAGVDQESLDILRDDVSAGRTAKLRLNLFSNVEYNAELERSAPTASGYTLSGPLDGVPFGRMVLVVNGGVTMGRVYTPQGNWSIRTVGEMQTVEPLATETLRCGLEAGPETVGQANAGGDVRDLPRLDRRSGGTYSLEEKAAEGERFEGFRQPLRREPTDETEAEGRARPSGTAATSRAGVASDDGDVVDVLVVYPSFARRFEGGYGNILSLIDLDIATANEAYAASGVDIRVELAAAVEVEYDWFLDAALMAPHGGYLVSFAHWSSALDHLAGRDDGYLDEVHELRDKHAADLVLLHLGAEATATIASPLSSAIGIGGLAFRVRNVATDVLEKSGFSVARSGDGTFVAHELGHSMGLRHDRYDDRSNRPFPYSHGFRYEYAPPSPHGGTFAPAWYGTVMSQYSNRERPGFVLAFSNPDLAHPDDPDLRLGVPGDEPSSAEDGPADATRHLNEVRTVLANVRARAAADPCRFEVVADEGEVSATGGTFHLKVETQPDCGWRVQTGEWVRSVSPLEGRGSGEVSYTVGANDGWKRSVEIMVAGSLHNRRQAGSRPITPVCERSRGVAFALERSHPDWDFTDPDTGYWSPRDCEELDFGAEYLASVRTLDPGGNKIYRGVDGSELRRGDFDGLTGLVDLWVNEVEHLPTEIFAGLTGLRVLDLSQRFSWEDDSAKLGSIAPGAFRDLPGLAMLLIDGHRLRRLEAGMLEGLTGLVHLHIKGGLAGPLTLGAGVFDALADLRLLALVDDGLARLDADLFDGLPTLRRLDLAINEIRSFPEGVFDGLLGLRQLDLRNNRIQALRSGIFDRLPALERLSLSSNRIVRLERGVFDRLTKLERLYLGNNRLDEIPGMPFASLHRLEQLDLGQNRLDTLDPGVFNNVSELRYLWLDDNRLRRLQPKTFDDLSNLYLLALSGNGMREIAPGAFEGLGALEILGLEENRLGTLEAGTFEGLERLRILGLYGGGVTSFEAGVFEPLARLYRLEASANRIRSLQRGALRGLRANDFNIGGNPGTPFTFAPTPIVVSADTAVQDQPVAIKVEIASATPFRVRVPLGAAGGRLSGEELLVEEGSIESYDSVLVTPDGDGPVTVGVEGQPVLVPEISWPDDCGPELLKLQARPCYSGVRLAAGPPLMLYGIEDRTVTQGREVEAIDLVDVFSYFLGTADYLASSSDEAVAAVRVEDGTLTVTPGGRGTAEITVTATGTDGETMTRRFTVTVRVPSVALFLSTSHLGREGFIRVINHSERSGTVRITAIDDGGNRHGPVRLRIRANGAAHFNSRDLEEGNEAKRLLEGIGPVFAEGDWRLEFDSDLDIEALSYVRTEDGFVTPVHDVAPSADGVHRIATFNPASNMQQASRLRVVNTGGEPAAVTVRGVDDTGASPGSPVRFSVPAGAAREFDAVQLETGDAEVEGAIGDGEGKWRLSVESASPVAAMSLLENMSTGHLTNLSSAPPPPDGSGVHHVGLFPSAGDVQRRQGFARVINRSEEAGVVRIDAFDDKGVNHGPLELAVGAGAVALFNSDDLELGASGKGLTGNTGPGEGDWRLELSSDRDIEVLAYVRTDEGFLTAIHDVVAIRDGRRHVPLFNPGSNTDQASRLRLANPLPEDVWVEVHGTDDAGEIPTDASAYVQVPAGAALSLTAAELESGIPDADFEGSWEREPLGDGAGKWRLSVVAEPGVLVQSLLESPSGHLTSLSTGGSR